jgi:hypothetical protein
MSFAPLPPNLAALQPLDMREALAALPQRRRPIGSSHARTSVTLHYAGTSEPGATTDSAALAQSRSEAVYHIGKIWGYADPKTKTQPIYGDGIMYHLAVLPSGRPVVMRDLYAILYHCANSTGNAKSLAITTLRGVGQQISDQHWAGVVALVEALTKDFSMIAGRAALKGHREWPRSDGAGQSICPGPILFDRLLHYRAGAPATALPLGRYRVTSADGLSVRTGPNVGYKKAVGDSLVYPLGHEFSVDAVLPDERGMARSWLHDANGAGFLAADSGLVTFLHP